MFWAATDFILPPKQALGTYLRWPDVMPAAARTPEHKVAEPIRHMASELGGTKWTLAFSTGVDNRVSAMKACWTLRSLGPDTAGRTSPLPTWPTSRLPTGFGLIKNHPFIDGNKRIAFVTANIFPLLNGYGIEAPEPQVVDITSRVADGSLDEAEFAAWIRSVLGSVEP